MANSREKLALSGKTKRRNRLSNCNQNWQERQIQSCKEIKKNKRKYIKSKVKLGKTYYVKVRAYRKVGKKVVYGKYSKAKKM